MNTNYSSSHGQREKSSVRKENGAVNYLKSKITETDLKKKNKMVNFINNAVSVMNVNLANGQDRELSLNITTSFLFKRLNMKEKDIIEALEFSDVMNDNTKQKNKRKIGTVTVKHKGCNIKFKSEVFEKLTEKMGITKFLLLCERYQKLIPEGGLFWSIIPDACEYIRSISEDKTIIEAFASPFNHNFDNYCSLFLEDIEYGAMGDFFINIKDYISDDAGTIWYVNPPYTQFLILKMMVAVKLRRELYPNDEFYFMLPYWEGEPELKELMDDVSFTIEAECCSLYNHLTSTEFNPNVKLFLGYMGNNTVEGKTIVDNIGQIIINKSNCKSEDLSS